VGFKKMAGGKGGASKKAVQKEKDKIIQDKTFGLKNKKNAKVQKYVAQVKQQVQNQGQKKVNPSTKRFWNSRLCTHTLAFFFFFFHFT